MVALALAYAKATGATLGGVSRKFYGNTGFLAAFKRGDKSISIDKFEEVIATFQQQWPEDAPWPTLRAVVIRGPTRKLSRRGNSVLPGATESH